MANKMQFYAQMAEDAARQITRRTRQDRSQGAGSSGQRSFGLQPGFINTLITNS